jgi:hypothetical protein
VENGAGEGEDGAGYKIKIFNLKFSITFSKVSVTFA